MRTNLVIAESCIQCGSCLGLENGWLVQAEDGSIKVVSGTFLNPTDSSVQELVSLCPVGAISVDTSVKEESAADEMKKIIGQLEQWNGIEKPQPAELKFKAKEYPIPIPYGSGAHSYNYSSSRAAERAASEELNRIMYSKIDTFILKAISEYRVRKVSPYYTKNAGNVYEKGNQTVGALLRDAKKLLERKGIAVPQSLCSFSVYPEGDIYWKMLNKGELISDEMVSMVRSQFNSLSSSGLSSYCLSVDTDDMETYGGTGLFGRTNYVTKYCYRSLNDACMEIAQDITWALDYCDDRIEDKAYEFACVLIDVYNESAKKALKDKINQLKGLAAKL